MKTPRTNPLLKWVSALALAGGLVYGLAKYRSSPPPARPIARPDSTALPHSPDITSQFLAIEAQRHQLDQTVWADEMSAQRHEAVFTKLWDDLRAAEDRFGVLEQFAFGQLWLGTMGDKSSAEHDIALRRTTSPAQRLTPETWRALLARLKDEGFRLEQSEWRHARFSADTNGAAQSIIMLTLHAAKAKPEERFIVRGQIRIDWRKPAQPDETPFPESITAVDLEVLSRPGPTPFDHKIVADLTTESSDARLWEPNLQLYDLDGDGLSEIILARRNLVYWNKGQGAFRPAPLLDQLLPEPGRADLQVRPTDLGESGRDKNSKSSQPPANTWLIADFDGDGRADVLAADAEGLALVQGDEQGHFKKPAKRIRFTNQTLPNPIVMTAGDVDRDGDLDVWLAQYKVPYQGGQMPTPYCDANDGWPAFFLENDGSGNFQDRTEASGLAAKRFRRAYSTSFVDLDEDGDLDLVVVSDFAGVDLYLNDGRGHFTDATQTLLDESHAFGMAHTFGDYDLDGRLDLFVIGMNSFAAERLNSLQLGLPGFEALERMRPKMAYGNRLLLARNSRFVQTALSDQVCRTGWSWGAATGDFDNDGAEDIYVVNGHISGESAADYESQFWRHDIYLGTSGNDPALDAYFRSVQSKFQGAGKSYGGFEKNRFFLNRGGKSFLEAGYLMGVALEDDCRNAVCDDLDGDGKLELLVTTFKVRPRLQQSLHLFPNFSSDAGHWIGIRLRESGPGFSPVGAQVILTTPRGRQIRRLVTGDSYRSQHANTAHFGLGSETQVTSVEVVWSNGRSKTVLNPAVNRCHLILPDQRQ